MTGSNGTGSMPNATGSIPDRTTAAANRSETTPCRAQGVVLVTGGAGFIGANFVQQWLRMEHTPVVNLDRLTYAGNLRSLAALRDDPRHIFVRGDIASRELVAALLAEYQPTAIVHLAAESHVDRSVHGPDAFVQTNVNGTFELLEASRAYWSGLDLQRQAAFRFLHVSTDEVYGSLAPGDAPFTERTAYAPNSPYSASKAASDHLVRAYHHTYGLPTLITHCSNNYGPFQYPEKLIPLMILNALQGKALPVYGAGLNVRDWIHVEDHCAGLRAVLAHGVPGETYNLGGDSERTNLQVVGNLCAILDELVPQPEGPRSRLIRFVKDRPGHDLRYAIDSGKAERELGWRPQWRFEEGLLATVRWYFDHLDWVSEITGQSYQSWLQQQYLEV